MMGPRSGLVSCNEVYSLYFAAQSVSRSLPRGLGGSASQPASAGAPHLPRKHIKWRILCLQVNQY